MRIQKNLRLWSEKWDLGISLQLLFIIHSHDWMFLGEERWWKWRSAQCSDCPMDARERFLTPHLQLYCTDFCLWANRLGSLYSHYRERGTSKRRFIWHILNDSVRRKCTMLWKCLFLTRDQQVCMDNDKDTVG